MAIDSKIQWTHSTWNIWVGCEAISPGCKNCYAANSTTSRVFGVKWGQGEERYKTISTTAEILKLQRKAAKTGDRYRVFTQSLSDIFDPAVPQEWRDEAFQIMGECLNLDFLLLTKRLLIMDAEQMLDMMPEHWRRGMPDNIWFGHSVCVQSEADRVIPMMAKIPASIHFISMEPMLQAIVLPGEATFIDWIIVGGESGPSARQFHFEWALSMVEQCRTLSIPVFVKQVGSSSIDCGQISDRKGGNIEEWPASLRVREWPRKSVEVATCQN